MNIEELEEATRRTVEREAELHCGGRNPSFCLGYMSALDRLHREGYLSAGEFVRFVKYMDSPFWGPDWK